MSFRSKWEKINANWAPHEWYIHELIDFYKLILWNYGRLFGTTSQLYHVGTHFAFVFTIENENHGEIVIRQHVPVTRSSRFRYRRNKNHDDFIVFHQMKSSLVGARSQCRSCMRVAPWHSGLAGPLHIPAAYASQASTLAVLNTSSSVGSMLWLPGSLGAHAANSSCHSDVNRVLR